MHAALLIDPGHLQRERDWYNRTVVGLLSSGVRITRIMPESELAHDRVALAPLVTYHVPLVQALARWRLLTPPQPLTEEPPNLIHAMGRGAWMPGLAYARHLDCPLVLSIWSEDELKQAVRFARDRHVAGLLPATAELAAELKLVVDPALVCTVPIGVFVPPKARRIFDESTVGVAGILAGHGAPLRAVRIVLDAFAEIASSRPRTMFFADLDPGVDDGAWKHGDRLGILDQLSIIPSVHQHRDLVLNADLLVIPHNTGFAGSFMLEAMAHPMFTVAARDPLLPELSSKPCARIVDAPEDPEAWIDAIQEILSDADEARRLAARAREQVAEDHPMSRQITLLHDVYEKILTGGALKLETA